MLGIKKGPRIQTRQGGPELPKWGLGCVWGFPVWKAGASPKPVGRGRYPSSLRGISCTPHQEPPSSGPTSIPEADFLQAACLPWAGLGYAGLGWRQQGWEGRRPPESCPKSTFEAMWGGQGNFLKVRELSTQETPSVTDSGGKSGAATPQPLPSLAPRGLRQSDRDGVFTLTDSWWEFQL